DLQSVPFSHSGTPPNKTAPPSPAGTREAASMVPHCREVKGGGPAVGSRGRRKRGEPTADARLPTAELSGGLLRRPPPPLAPRPPHATPPPAAPPPRRHLPPPPGPRARRRRAAPAAAPAGRAAPCRRRWHS